MGNVSSKRDPEFTRPYTSIAEIERRHNVIINTAVKSEPALVEEVLDIFNNGITKKYNCETDNPEIVATAGYYEAFLAPLSSTRLLEEAALKYNNISAMVTLASYRYYKFSENLMKTFRKPKEGQEPRFIDTSNEEFTRLWFRAIEQGSAIALNNLLTHKCVHKLL